MPTRLIVLTAIALLALPVEAKQHKSAGEQWEQSLLNSKKHGTLPGPRKGQKCLWSKRLGGCLWYTPGKWDR